MSLLISRSITVLSVIEGAKLCLAAAAATAALGCAASESRRTVPSYDPFTGKLVRLAADQDGNGRAEQWTYMDGNQPLRGEADLDDDGRIDRWEYFDAQSALVLIGTASRGDGVEDTWTWPAATRDGEMHTAVSRRRDRHRDRHEYLRDNVLVRAEEDTNGDGRIDKWERYEGGALREAAFDTTFTTGRADRRVRYGTQGTTVEEDRDGDGKFVQVRK
jgi:hypothetical protein